MKKFIGALLALSVVAAVVLPEQQAEAQVVPLTLRCCDSAGYVRCTLVNWTPVGNPCFCNYQGWGTAC